MKNYVKLLEQFLEENKIQLPTWLFDDPEDFEDWFENGMELEKGKIAPFSSTDEKKLLDLIKTWTEAEDDYRNGRGDLGTGRTGSARAASYKAQDEIKRILTQKGKVVSEQFIEEAVKIHSTANGTAGVPTTSTGADSEDQIIPLAKQAPVLNFGIWAQNATNVQPNNAYPDALLAQAAMHGMTPQEYLAYYGHSTDGHDK